jgi:hypothetical protein
MMMVASWVCVQHPNPVQYHCDEPAGSIFFPCLGIPGHIFLNICSKHDPNVGIYHGKQKTVPCPREHFRIGR